MGRRQGDGRAGRGHAGGPADGIPAVMVTDTSFLRNPSYHSPGDTAATLDYDRVAKVVEEVCNSVLSLFESAANKAASRAGGES
jgi:hypothetical protein